MTPYRLNEAFLAKTHNLKHFTSYANAVHPYLVFYLVFVTIQASLLVKKANEILSATRNTYEANECRRQQATFSEAPSFLTSRILPF